MNPLGNAPGLYQLHGPSMNPNRQLAHHPHHMHPAPIAMPLSNQYQFQNGVVTGNRRNPPQIVNVPISSYHMQVMHAQPISNYHQLHHPVAYPFYPNQQLQAIPPSGRRGYGVRNTANHITVPAPNHAYANPQQNHFQTPYCPYPSNSNVHSRGVYQGGSGNANNSNNHTVVMTAKYPKDIIKFYQSNYANIHRVLGDLPSNKVMDILNLTLQALGWEGLKKQYKNKALRAVIQRPFIDDEEGI
eukprot:251521_1